MSYTTSKYGGYSVHYVVSRFLYVVGNHILKGQHPLDIQVAGSGYQISLIGIFSGKLVAN